MTKIGKKDEFIVCLLGNDLWCKQIIIYCNYCVQRIISLQTRSKQTCKQANNTVNTDNQPKKSHFYTIFAYIWGNGIKIANKSLTSKLQTKVQTISQTNIDKCQINCIYLDFVYIWNNMDLNLQETQTNCKQKCKQYHKHICQKVAFL